MLQAKEKLILTLMNTAAPDAVTADLREKIGKLVREGNFIRPRIEGIMNIWFYKLDGEMLNLVTQLHDKIDDAIFHPEKRESTFSMLNFDFLSAAVYLSPTYTYDWALIQRRLCRTQKKMELFAPLTVAEFVETPLMRTLVYPEFKKETLATELYNYTNKMYDVQEASDGRLLLVAPNGKTEFMLTKEWDLL